MRLISSAMRRRAAFVWLCMQRNRSDKIMDAERAYEAGGLSIGTIFKEDGRYRAWASTERLDCGLYMAVKGATSPDGLNWTPIEQPLAMMHSDTHVVAYYDTQLKKYVGYFRDWVGGLQADAQSYEDDPQSASRWLHFRRPEPDRIAQR